MLDDNIIPVNTFIKESGGNMLKKLCCSIPPNMYAIIQKHAEDTHSSLSSRVVQELCKHFINEGYDPQWLMEEGRHKRRPNDAS